MAIGEWPQLRIERNRRQRDFKSSVGIVMRLLALQQFLAS